MMRIFLSIKYHDDQSNRATIELILATMEKRGHTATCIVRDIERWGEIKFDAAELMQRTFREIDANDLVVVDLTEQGIGVGIEAGYTFAKNIPIVTIAHRGADISSTLQSISRKTFFYNNVDDLDSWLGQIDKMNT